MQPTDLPTFAAEPPSGPVQFQPRAWVEQIMGMPVSIHVRGPGVRDEHSPEFALVTGAVERAFAGLRAVDARFSTYRADSELCRVQRGEIPPERESEEMLEVRALCQDAEQRTGNWFSTEDPAGRFDPTGLVKGWAVEACALGLSQELNPDDDSASGFDVMVNAGGDIAVRSVRVDTPDWVIGIENPADRSQLLATVPLRTGGVATSGSAARGAHIWNPHNRRETPAYWHAVTVIGPNLTWADVFATAAYAREGDAVDWLAEIPEHVALLVDRDGRTTSTEGPAHGWDPGNSQVPGRHC
jgi:thiamine biosynthesis lipoprotein